MRSQVKTHCVASICRLILVILGCFVFVSGVGSQTWSLSNADAGDPPTVEKLAESLSGAPGYQDQPRDAGKSEPGDAANTAKAGESDGWLPIYVSPFYDSRGPMIEVGKFSKELTEANEKSILTVVATMRKEWGSLSTLQMYVAAIRLFDLGHRDEAVYWFYMAQYRSRVFQNVLEKEGTPMDPNAATIAGWLNQVHPEIAFYQLVGAYLSTYAFRDPQKLRLILRRVRNEYKALPCMSKLYPFLRHVPDDKWQAANDEISDGLVKLQDLVDSLKDLKGDAVKGALEEKTPLHKAFEAGDKEQYSKLLKEGADPNFRPRLATCLLHETARQKDPFWLQTALKHGADPNLLDTAHPFAPGYTLLLSALSASRHDNVDLLIKAGADVNADYKGTHPLFVCQRARMWPTMMAMLDADADPRRAHIKRAFNKEDAEYHIRHYNNPGIYDHILHEDDRQQFGLDYTLEKEKEMFFKVRARLIKDGLFNPDEKVSAETSRPEPEKPSTPTPTDEPTGIKKKS